VKITGVLEGKRGRVGGVIAVGLGQQPLRGIVGHLDDRPQSGEILFNRAVFLAGDDIRVIFIRAKVTIGIRIQRAITRHVGAGDGIALAGPRGVGDDQPGIEDPRELDDAEDQEQEHRQDQREFHHALAARAALARPLPGRRIFFPVREQFGNHTYLFYPSPSARPIASGG
jgi:hypothetical protein